MYFLKQDLVKYEPTQQKPNTCSFLVAGTAQVLLAGLDIVVNQLVHYISPSQKATLYPEYTPWSF